MEDYLPPLSIIFIWHPSDAIEVNPIVEHITLLLSRDINKPFSRAMNVPTFYRTTSGKSVPSEINILSEKTVIIVFLSEEVVCDDDWKCYVENLPIAKNTYIVPIALDDTCLQLKGSIEGINCIRKYDYNQIYINEYMFISITHEIYRCALNDSFEELATGKQNAIQLFLSHTKNEENGIKVANALKKFIDNSAMANFFDTTDIAPGYKFKDEISKNIEKSSIISIQSDLYSSKYWCQMELLCAKKYDRPIIAVDIIKEFEDRRFPFASNIPGVYIHLNDEPSEKDLLKILSVTLLETVRFFYSKRLLKSYKQIEWIEPDAELRSRPPEISDLEKLLEIDRDGLIGLKHKSLIYPDPPVYLEELTFLSELGIKIATPLTLNLSSLKDKYIGISISDPSENELIILGQDSSQLVKLSQDIARYLLTRDATLIYGGDLREGGFTEFIFDEAQALQARLNSKNIHIVNYIAWPIYVKDTKHVKHWQSKYNAIVKMKKIPAPLDVKDLIPCDDYFLPPINVKNMFVWSCCLTEMRTKMITQCNIRICAGGKHFGYKGIMPGVLEEILIAIKLKRPLFLLGGFGGVTASVCKFIQSGVLPKELNLDWQIQNNVGYKEMLDFHSNRGGKAPFDYSSLVKVLKIDNLNNGLSEKDNYKLFDTPFIEEAIQLILKGLKCIK